MSNCLKMWCREFEYRKALKLVHRLYQTTRDAPDMNYNEILGFETEILDCMLKMANIESYIPSRTDIETGFFMREINSYHEYSCALDLIEKIYCNNNAEAARLSIGKVMLHLLKMYKKNRDVAVQLESYICYEV